MSIKNHSILFLLLIYLNLFPEIMYINKLPIWKSDSLWVGAGAIVKDSSIDIIVALDTSLIGPKGDLYYTMPYFGDSLVFLFHNRKNIAETVKNIGKFPEGTPLIFAYVVTDSSLQYAHFKDIFIYTGQNREDIDLYVTKRPSVGGSIDFGKRFGLAGKFNGDNAEFGFSSAIPIAYIDIIFHANNIILEVKDKNITPVPHAIPRGKILYNSTMVSLNVPSEGLLAIEDTDIKDTVSAPLKSGAILKIFYTLDGTDPRNSQTRRLYTDSINITETSTLKAYAEIEGDTLWYPSPVITEHYVIDNTPVRFARSKSKKVEQNMGLGNMYIYSLIGRKMTAVARVKSMRNTEAAAGYYIVKANGQTATIKVQGIYQLQR